MPHTDPATWTDRLRQTLQGYDEPLLRAVAGKLLRPRSHWPPEDLIERMAQAAGNAVLIDRRLQDLPPAARQALAVIGHSRQPRWGLGSLVELVVSLGHADGLAPLLALLESGLLFPELPPADSPNRRPLLRGFDQWLGRAAGAGLPVFAHPAVAARALGEDLGLPDLSTQDSVLSTQEADGLEWPLRLAVLWQQAAAAPLRRTQSGEFFKRDLERLQSDPLLSAPPAEGLADLPQPALLAEALAEAEGILAAADGEVRAAALPAAWEDGLAAALESLWLALPRLATWNPLDGWRSPPAVGNPFPSAYLLAFLLLGRLPKGAWARPADLEAWLQEHHPYWSVRSPVPSGKLGFSPELRSWLPAFLLGLAYQLRLVQAARGADGEWLVRLSPTGRWLLGLGEPPAPPPAFPQTLLVQPNLEIIAYRQGLTPGLIARLARFARWKGLGPACTLQLEPDSVYRGLERGETFETMLHALERHGTRAVPPAVADSLRTWADKRDRISVYPSAVLLEFGSADDLNEALKRGLPAARLSGRLALVVDESAIDFRHFRLTGTRDYGLPPERCVTVEPDGVTLSIDAARSDLLLETELPRFAEPVSPSANGRRQYRLTPASLAAGQGSGLSVPALEVWFHQRAGQPLSAAARLLLTAPQLPPPEMKRHLVLHVATEELADGLVQWPGTSGLIQARLGPTALAVAEEDAEALKERLRQIGVALE